MNKILFFVFAMFFAASAANAQTTDFLAEDIVNPEIPDTNLDYNYESTFSIPIELEIVEKLSTKDPGIHEGKIVNFKVKNSVAFHNKVILKSGTVIPAKIKYIVKSGMNGIPYSIVVGDFDFPELDADKIKNEYQKDGFDRSYFVFPLKWALTFLPPAGSLTNFIKGGHAKITPRDKITLYYFPYWKK